jgi:phospholipase/carboxylesterase
MISVRNYVAVAPRGNAKITGRRGGFAWSNSPAGFGVAEQDVFASIEAASTRFHVAPRRIFLAGYQCGGTMALRIALRWPDRFAGVLSLGGAFPQDDSPLSSINAARAIPLFIAQGRTSNYYPEESLCDNLRLIHSAGLSVTIRHYPCGDELTSGMLHDMDVWMMEIVTGEVTSPQHRPVTLVELN